MISHGEAPNVCSSIFTEQFSAIVNLINMKFVTGIIYKWSRLVKIFASKGEKTCHKVEKFCTVQIYCSISLLRVQIFPLANMSIGK